MGTSLPKVLHTVNGKRMIDRVLDAVSDSGLTQSVVVRDSSTTLPEALGLTQRMVVQNEQDGTGGALRAILEDGAVTSDYLLVLNGDLPLITPQTLTELRKSHESAGPNTVITFLTCESSKGAGMGHVRRSEDGHVVEIVEATDPGYGDSPSESNVGVYALNLDWARTAVDRLPRHDNGEYYITDLVTLAVSDGLTVETIQIDADEAIGVNTLVDLAEAEQAARRRTLESLMLSGVRIVDPASTYIDATVTVAPDSIIHPNTHITRATTIGAGSEIGPDTHITDSTIGERCVVRGSWLDEVALEDGVSVGPYARLRPGTHIGEDAHIGSFGEIKASRIGSRSCHGALRLHRRFRDRRTMSTSARAR